MSLTVFPISSIELFTRSANEADSLRSLVAATRTTMGQLAEYHARDGYSRDGDWTGYRADADYRTRLHASDWALITTAHHLAIKATQQQAALADTLTHLSALYPQMQTYQRMLGVEYDDTVLDWDHVDTGEGA